MRDGTVRNLLIIFLLFIYGDVLGEDIQSVPLQFISFSAVPDLPFAERLLTYRAGSNVVGEESSKIESLNATSDTCPAESECSFMSNCPTLRRLQPATRCEVSISPSRGLASLKLPGGTCCRHGRQSSSFSPSRPLPVLSVAINSAAFGESGQDGAEFADPDLRPRGRKSGHLANFVVPPNAAGTEQYGGKSPLVLLAPNKGTKLSFLPGEAPVDVRQTGSFTPPSSSATGPIAPQTGPSISSVSSVNGAEKSSQFFANPSSETPIGPNTTGGGAYSGVSPQTVQNSPVASDQFPQQQQQQQIPFPQQGPPQYNQPRQNIVQPPVPSAAPVFQQTPVQQYPVAPPPTNQQPQQTTPTGDAFGQYQNQIRLQQQQQAFPQQQGQFQGPPQPSQPTLFALPGSGGSLVQQPVPTQQQYLSPLPVPVQQNTYQPPQQMPPQPMPQQQYFQPIPVFNQQPQNYPPQQMPVPLIQSYGSNPGSGFLPPRQPLPPLQMSPQQPLLQMSPQQPQFQFITPSQNQTQMVQTVYIQPQPLQQQMPPPSRMSVVPQQASLPAPNPPPAFSAFNAFSATSTGPANTFCGVADPSFLGRSGRILGGRPSNFGVWPWMAVILSSRRLRCGATILNEQFLITAAHCVYKNYQYGYYQDLTVRIGLFSMDEEDIGPYAPQEVRINRVFVHPYFNVTASSYDIALIQVSSPIIFKEHIKPVCLPSYEHLGEMGTVLGWGKRKESDDRSNLPMVLQEVNMPILYPWQCMLELRSNQIYEDIGPQFVCAGGKANQDACRGDSGGPLLALSNGQYWEMIGIVSKGYGCGKENTPGIYTNIFYLKDWIESTVSNNWIMFSGAFGSRERSDTLYYR